MTGFREQNPSCQVKTPATYFGIAAVLGNLGTGSLLRARRQCSDDKIDWGMRLSYACDVMQMGTLRLFCHVIETGSFSVAAEKHGVTPSSVSQTLARLEKEWGVTLVTRGPHGIGQVTPAGKAAYGPASDIIRLAGELHRAQRRTREAADTDIRLAACYSIGLHQLPPFLRRFNARFPDIHIHLRYGLIDGVHHDVQENEADLGLACYPRRRPGLVVDLFRHERLLLVCHPEHPLAARPAVALAECRRASRRMPAVATPFASDGVKHLWPSVVSD
jgi:DNA-binding transcriptional LysR family regulator